ncbi:MAG: hypothetical protein FWG67_08195 [Defluviitaleaceae bacterium]|nr:hypothetical protein [Defluviitaleaceae bacterium]
MKESELGIEVEEVDKIPPSSQPKQAQKSEHQLKTPDSDLVDRIKQLSEKNARNKELSTQKRALNLELLEKLENSLAESNRKKELTSQRQEIRNFTDKPEVPTGATVVQPADDVVLEESKETEIKEPSDVSVEPPVAVVSTPVDALKEDVKTPEPSVVPALPKVKPVDQPKQKRTTQDKKKSAAFRIVINGLFYLAFAAILGSVLLSGIEHTSGEELLDIMGFSMLRTRAENREPELQTNTLIIIRNLDPNELEINQMATYKDEAIGAFMTHRIYQIERDEQGNHIGFVLDRNDLYWDGDVVPSEQMLGRVVFTNYPLGRFLSFFETSLTLKILVATGVLILLYTAKQMLIDRLLKTTSA